MDEESEEPILLELLADLLSKTGPDPAAQALAVVRFFEQHGVDLYPEPPLDPEVLAEIEAARGLDDGIPLDVVLRDLGLDEQGLPLDVRAPAA
jgi:hypothetical protein